MNLNNFIKEYTIFFRERKKENKIVKKQYKTYKNHEKLTTIDSFLNHEKIFHGEEQTQYAIYKKAKNYYEFESNINTGKFKSFLDRIEEKEEVEICEKDLLDLVKDRIEKYEPADAAALKGFFQTLGKGFFFILTVIASGYFGHHLSIFLLAENGTASGDVLDNLLYLLVALVAYYALLILIINLIKPTRPYKHLFYGGSYYYLEKLSKEIISLKELELFSKNMKKGNGEPEGDNSTT